MVLIDTRRTEKLGDQAPETADLYYAYGKALLENAIAQSSVIGKDQPEGNDEDHGMCFFISSFKHSRALHVAAAAPSGSNLISFSGDGDDDPTVDLSALVPEDEEDAEEDENREGEDEDPDAEPEDDFNAAWEVLDLARNIYDDQKKEHPDDKRTALKLADVYILLGDVSLETGMFYNSNTFQ